MATEVQKITPHLWFDREAREAAELYTSIIPNSKITNLTTLHDTPSGDSEIVSFELSGQPFMAISAGPFFKINPSVSFHVRCATRDEVDRIWNDLSPGGMALMELGPYPWSERYGWLLDKFGLSWQIIHTDDSATRQKIVPAIMFVGGVCGKAEEAIQHFISVFQDGKIGSIERYGEGEGPDKEGTVKYASFMLFGQEFTAMDSAYDHQFAFNEAISFIVHCNTQEEIDRYWEKLSAVPEAEQCGWLKDKFGFSWQIVPTTMDEMMASNDPEKIARVTQAFLPMKKLDIAVLQKAYEGR